jgi:hypothetical protein
MPSNITERDITLAAEGLFRFRELTRLLSGVQLSFTEVMIGLAGLLFYLALLRIVLRFKDFRRTDADYHWLASRHNMLGDFAKALRYLANVKSRTAETEVIHIIGLLGVNQIGRAEERTKVLISQNGEQPTIDSIFQIMLDACFLAPIPEGIIASLISAAVENRVADFRLQDAVWFFLMSYPQSATSVENALLQHKDGFPLAYARLLILLDRPSDALHLLEKATPGTELEELIRLVMQLQVCLLNPDTSRDEDTQTFQIWAESNLPTIRDLLANLAQPWEKAIAFGQLGILRAFASQLGKDREQEIAFLADEVKAQTTADPKADLLARSMEIRLNSLMKGLHRSVLWMIDLPSRPTSYVQCFSPN